MTTLCNEEGRVQPPRRCKDIAAALRDAFMQCRKCKGRKVSLSVQEEEDEDNPISDFGNEHEVVVWEIRNRAMEKLRHKPKTLVESFSWAAPSGSTDQDAIKEEDEEEEGSEFCSVGSCFSECCSSGLSKEAYVSARTEISCCSSLMMMEFENPWKMYLKEFKERSVIQEFCHCEGWPFGLARKAVLLPPLPKSPAESWSWRKRHRVSASPFI
ncbi:PREDICTED: uncharacterized protein LOC104806945 [Tarenaya hassleriana]|uniref:uncharacterized protein LOC104806945 n=1 Tax=Tarenaya hassleriana TaxID=28532 RepID=UPI00053C9B49|nr:PREDICTED: uncharacterized protein LOC104806945 [Tarenaya hassleriana]